MDDMTDYETQAYNYDALFDVSPCDCPNPVCSHNTSDEERAKRLLEFTDDLAEAGWPDIRLVPLWENSQGPKIRKGDSIEDAETVTPGEAARRIREDGVRGFYLYADRDEHGTERLVFLDRDEPEKWPETPETIRIVSGSGTSDHLPYRSDGTVERAKGKGDLEGAGSVQARNWGVVVPGSIHRDCDGIYHVDDGSKIGKLSADDLPPELRPASGSGSSGSTSYDPPKSVDEDAVETVQGAICEFRTRSDTTRRAIEYFTDLREGKNYREWEFVSKDGSGDRHEANVSLASKLYGILRDAWEAKDDDRAEWLISEYLARCARKWPYTDDGQPRKLSLSAEYRRETAREAINTFDRETFTRWKRKRYNPGQWTDDYSVITYETVMDAIIDLSCDEDFPIENEYPTRREITDLCRLRDGRAEKTYQNALSNLVREGEIKRAIMAVNVYVYYLPWDDDPENAVEIYRPNDDSGRWPWME